MKVFCYFLLSTFTYFNPLQAQIFSGPNKSVNGLRTGLWVEQKLYSKIDSTGNYFIPLYQHYTPRYVITEGVYEKSQRIGFWKEFWIERDSMDLSIRGSIKALVEYKNGVPDGLFFEFYPNGNLRAMGWSESYRITDTAFTFEIYDSNGKNPKDTTIHVTHGSRMAGNGFYFAATDSSSLKFRKLNSDLSAITVSNPLQAQIFYGPNKSVEGLRTGFWVEKQVYSQIDSTGDYHFPSYHHGQPLYVIAEGFYEKSKQVDFWKEYWRELDSTRHYQRGTIKSLVEYKNGVPDGLFFEFYPNGNLRAMGTNESYPVNPESKTFSIPDFDTKEIKMKDTTIHITHRSRIAGNGFYFAETKTSSLKFRKLNAD